MERITNIYELQQNIEAILQDVDQKGDTIVVEQEDEPAAVLVSVKEYLQWKENREMFAEMKRKRAEKDGMSDEEVEANDLIEEAKWWIRLKDKIGSTNNATD